MFHLPGRIVPWTLRTDQNSVRFPGNPAAVTQLVAYQLPKLGVAGSSPVSRSS